MRVLVTGANGFMGSFLSQQLSSKYEIVTGVRDLNTAPDVGETREIPELASSSDWTGIFDDIDIVLHLAARVHVMNETAVDPLDEFMEVNSRATIKMAEAAVSQGVKRFVFMSTVKVHGEGHQTIPYRDSDVPRPVDDYGISKWDAEQKLSELSRHTSMEVVILRSPVVYGVGVKGNIALFSKLVKAGAPLPFGMVNNRRRMLSLNNLAVWVENALAVETVPIRPVLMGDPNPTSTKLLSKSLAEGMGKTLFLIPVPVSLMNFAALVVGKRNISRRLFGNFDLEPSFYAFDGLERQLSDSGTELRNLGSEIAEEWS